MQTRKFQQKRDNARRMAEAARKAGTHINVKEAASRIGIYHATLRRWLQDDGYGDILPGNTRPISGVDP